jgi:hypothetical protein
MKAQLPFLDSVKTNAPDIDGGSFFDFLNIKITHGSNQKCIDAYNQSKENYVINYEQ